MDRYGTTYKTDVRGRLIRVQDRAGSVSLEIEWSHHTMDRLVVPGTVVPGTFVPGTVVPGAVVHGRVLTDALLGSAHAIFGARVRATTMSAIDWTHSTEIPAIAAPALVPASAAAPLMNALAILAARAGVTALRSAGPYPSSALWRTLLRSFTTAATGEVFTQDFLSRAAAPFAVVWCTLLPNADTLMEPG